MQLKKGKPGATPHPASYELSERLWFTHCSPTLASNLTEWIVHCCNGEVGEDEDGNVESELIPIPVAFVDWLRENASEYIMPDDMDCEPGHEVEPYVILNYGMAYLMGSIMATKFREMGLEEEIHQTGLEELAKRPEWQRYLPQDPRR